MDRAIATRMMEDLIALSVPMNALSESSLSLKGEERSRVRKQIGEMMGVAATLVLNISREHPELDPDRRR